MKYLLVTLVLVSILVCGANAAVDLEWHPAVQIAHVNDTVNMGLYIASDSGVDWPVSAMDVIVFNEPSYLQFSGLIQIPNLWLTDGLLTNAPDDLNKKTDDGDMIYTGWVQLGQSMMVPPTGLLCTSFQFTAAAAVGETDVAIPAGYGTNAKTVVYDGREANLDVTGLRGTAKVMIVPQDVTVVGSVAQAKAQTDESSVALTGPVVTRSFDFCFYMEDPSRACGIRVNCLGQPPAEGTSPMVWGVIRTVAGERVIDNATIGSGTPALVPGAVAMNGGAVTVGLSPQGLLVRLTGRVAGSSGGTEFTLTDGSSQPVKIELHSVTAPANGVYAAVTGALGADASGPVLRVNRLSDLSVLQE